MASDDDKRRRGWAKGPPVHHLLAYSFAPLFPLARRIPFRHTGKRGHEPEDILLPDGYVAEVVASGFSTPVHCTFAPDGTCYVFECGYKLEQRPRILRVDTATGQSDVFFEWPEERWIKTCAVTGGCWYDGHLYVANTERSSIVRLDPTGRYRTHWGITSADTLRGPHVAVGKEGGVYVTEPSRGRVSRFSPDGQPAGMIEGVKQGRLLRQPLGIAVGPDGTLYIADPGLKGVVALTIAGASP